MQEPYEDALAAARAELEKARALLQQDISEYPHPISGCDYQYVRLISDRTRIANCLHALDNQPFVATPRVLEPAG
ncbi:hypothetical protein SAMN02745824_1985 [Parasphingorhabdus marina DSM 22363]|uniref:Uncharacterized protein n=1 Tax=Parasphingorhabdus marina DSM 22363 TaxID=1123272 RepID=A0A1N6ELG0_9SPHN|nr:hypothetical protein [Parasphingorhabdus marina]SIN83838.1 hypothetical protein SAMN02745824_1985 [Parasphingorhabdus marina DSM 22363]